MKNKTKHPVTIKVLPSDQSAPITIKMQLAPGSRIRVLFDKTPDQLSGANYLLPKI